MKNILSNPRISSVILVVSGLAIIFVTLIKHPEDWRNWLIRAGIGAIVVVATLSVLYVIQYLINRKRNQ
jgi:hypothetical protein